jgi:hypothetical protein
MEKQLSSSVNATLESGRKGEVAAPGIEPKIRFSAPPEFKGDPGFWTPNIFFWRPSPPALS